MRRVDGVLGAIVGDIVGSVYEWNNIKTKDFELFSKKGFFTDDTVMTLAVANALCRLRNKCVYYYDEKNHELHISPFSIREKEFKEVLIDCFHDFGKVYPDSGFGGRFAKWLAQEKRTPYGSYGNGSAMRVSPVAYASNSIDEVIWLATITSKITHNHPEGIKGAVATAVAIFLARNGKTKQEIKEYITKNYYDLDFTLDEIRPTYAFNETCQETVPQALQAFFESTDFEDAIRNAISIGGDSDTLAAITGSVAGAFYGVPDEIEQKAISYLDRKLENVYYAFAWARNWKNLIPLPIIGVACENGKGVYMIDTDIITHEQFKACRVVPDIDLNEEIVVFTYSKRPCMGNYYFGIAFTPKKDWDKRYLGLDWNNKVYILPEDKFSNATFKQVQDYLVEKGGFVREKIFEETGNIDRKYGVFGSF